MNEFVTLPEAARRANVSTTSVRRWISGGALKAFKNKDNQWEIEINGLHTFLATQHPNRSALRATTVRNGATTQKPLLNNSTSNGSLNVGASESYFEALKEAREALARERRINDEMRAKINDLEQERTKHLAEMRALLGGDKEKVGKLSRWIRSI